LLVERVGRAAQKVGRERSVNRPAAQGAARKQHERRRVKASSSFGTVVVGLAPSGMRCRMGRGPGVPHSLRRPVEAVLAWPVAEVIAAGARDRHAGQCVRSLGDRVRGGLLVAPQRFTLTPLPP
jgi:hypothetical protein